MSQGSTEARPALVLGLGLLAFALLTAWIGLDGVIGGAVVAERTVTISTGAAAALPPAVMLALLAAMLLLPRRRMSDRRSRLLFRLVLGCAPLLVVLPLLFLAVSSAILPTYGYQRCHTAIVGQRFLNITWTRGDPRRCPAAR